MSVTDVLPPSPPTTSSKEKPSLSCHFQAFTRTPDDSPASLPGSGGRKRVEFSPWTNVHDPPAFTQSDSHVSTNVRSLRPSRECQSSSKSILKAVAGDDKLVYGPDGPQDINVPMSEMIESIVQQLSKDDRALSVDAYQTLASMIKTYDEIPEEAVLKNKIGAILKFVKRDLAIADKSDVRLADTGLITQALKILIIFVWSRDFSPLLSDEYRAFILDRSIQTLVEHTAPKSVIIHYLHLLATQDFRSGLLTSNSRTARLLDALKLFTEHVKGNGAVSERLLVYHKLMDQARPIMKAKANSWIEELLTGMTNTLGDTRAKAIALGMKACSAFPASSSISTLVRAALEREQENKRTLGENMCRRLEKMVAAKEEAIQVPQVWAIVLLLSNGLDARIDTWSAVKDWLRVIQKCFNSGDSAVRQQANMAWNRFVYIVKPHEAPESFVSMLSRPVALQLERPTSDKALKGSRAVAVSSYCNLLYYAFRPAATHKQYTRSWNEYIVKVMKSSFFAKNPANADLASRILMTLLWNSRTSAKLWNENRAHENRLVEPEELPTIDCKWVRAKAAAITAIFRILFQYSSWGASGQSDKAYISQAWNHFLKALREAGSKEIKQSSDTKQAVAAVATLLSRLWIDNAPKDRSDRHHGAIYPRWTLAHITRTALVELGVTPLLSAIETGSEQCPTLFLFEIIHLVMSGMSENGGRSESRAGAFSSRDAIRGWLPVLERSLDLLSSTAESVYQESTKMCPSALVEVLEGLDDVLLHIPGAILIPSLIKLSPCLAALIQDRHQYMVHTGKDANVHLSTAYGRLLEAVLGRLEEVKNGEIESLDQLLAAAFESTHDGTVNQMFQRWKKSFGQTEELRCGPKLEAALLTLSPHVEPTLPGLEDEAERPEKLHSAVGSEPRDDVSQTAEAAVRSRPNDETGPPSSVHEQNRPAERMNAAPGMERTPNSKCSMAGPRPRHDDSQIQFVTIDSSPFQPDDRDSQYLTTHQKEVRERQRIEPAVVFPDLRSGPKAAVKPNSQSDCEFARKAAAALVDRPATPPLPPQNDHTEVEALPSPTPRARHLATKITDFEVPSSPLSAHGAGGVETDVLSSPLQTPTEEASIGIELALTTNNEKEDHAETAEARHGQTQEAESSGMILQVPLPAPSTSDFEMDAFAPEHHDAGQQAPADQMFSPAVSSRATENADVEPAVSTSPGRTGRIESDEIDFLSASQLSNDLDRHISSQARASEALEEQLSEPHPPSESRYGAPGKKRKRWASGCANHELKRKRRRTSIHSKSDAAQAPELSGDPEVDQVLDCIVVDHTAQETQTFVTELSETGQEGWSRSSSSSLLPSPKKRRGRPRKYPRPEPARAGETDTGLPTTLKIEADDGSDVDVVLQEQGHASVDRHISVPEQQVEVSATEEVTVANATHSDVGPPVSPGRPRGTRTCHPAHPGACNNDEATSANTEASSDIVQSLQQVLDRLKTAAPGEIDLRAVDELCFQIRFRAQMVMQES